MVEKTPTLADAISAAVDEATPEKFRAAETTSESVETTDDPAADPSTTLDDADPNAAPPVEVDDAGATDEPGAGEVRPDDEIPADETPEAKATREAAAAAAAAAAAGGDKPAGEKGAKPKKPDPVNDPISPELSKETRERIQTLIKLNKDGETKFAETQQNLDYIVRGVQATGTTPEQYGELLSFMSLFNSGKVDQQAKALELLDALADRLAGVLGKERSQGDPLTGFDDLKQAVAQGQMTKDWAKQLALTRRQHNIRGEVETYVRDQHQTKEAAERELAKARSDLNDLEQSLIKTDPQYYAKKAMILPILQPIFAGIAPKEWKEKFQAAYSRAKVGNAGTALAAARRNGAAGPQVPVNQPLRARNPAGGGARAPASMGEAINAALAELGK